MSKTFFCAVLFLLISGTACIAQSSDEPSLGDVARKHRGEVKPVKTLTNEDVATARPGTSNEPAASTSAASGSAVSNSSSSKTETKADNKKSAPDSSASKDSSEVAELKNKINSLKAEQDGWKSAAKKNQDLLANESDDFRRQMYQDRLQGDQDNVQVYQDKIDQAQADLAKAEKNASGH